MTLTLDVTGDAVFNGFEAFVAQVLEEVRLKGQLAMADAYYGIVMANFGSAGFDRPWAWPPLSPAYAKRVGRTFATLYVTGALKDTVQKDISNPEVYMVSMGNTATVPYALAHHYGVAENNLPARRVFPMFYDDSMTDKTADLVEKAARAAVREALA